MRYFAYLHNVEIGRKLCSFICEKSYEFYEFVRSVPAFGDFVAAPRGGGWRGGPLMWGRWGKGETRKGFYSISINTAHLQPCLEA